LFAQILVGTTPERWLDWLLRATAWITLALGPIGILLEFQLKFFPYHSRLVTGTHRLLLFVELAIALVLFPLVFHAGRVFQFEKRNMASRSGCRLRSVCCGSCGGSASRAWTAGTSKPGHDCYWICST